MHIKKTKLLGSDAGDTAKSSLPRRYVSLRFSVWLHFLTLIPSHKGHVSLNIPPISVTLQPLWSVSQSPLDLRRVPESPSSYLRDKGMFSAVRNYVGIQMAGTGSPRSIARQKEWDNNTDRFFFFLFPPVVMSLKFWSLGPRCPKLPYMALSPQF